MTDGRVTRGRRTREAIVEATIALLREDGAAAVTHRAVAARAGTSLAATTYHFATLDDLLVVAFELLTDRMVEEVERLAELVLSGRMDLVEAAITFVEEVDADEDFVADGMIELAYGAIRNERLRKPTQRLVDHMGEPFAELIGGESARVLIRALNGMLLHHRAAGPDASTGELRSDVAVLFEHFGLTTAVRHRLEEES
ncbi:TetR/AcrR family transcriptional regulator [Nocardioides humilatus]|uniref:TetR/AcrR family transcriptional regulator n=1 Tax=Nocardioides humilatus TaxID=2607660 RepID=UPI00165EF7EE|nr:TetR family transcriptional regulator [Nocardioides humilatus]